VNLGDDETLSLGIDPTMYKRDNHLRPRDSSIQIPFCLIRAGSFEREGHIVKLTRDFWMAKYPVTQRVWITFMGSNPSKFREGGDLAPVERVSWYDVQEFLGKVGNDLRLPTEAEWEYACRAGTNGAYNVDGVALEQLGWYDQNAGSTTHPVGEKLPNAWGLHDMHGNVREWCLDSFGSYSSYDVTEPTGPDKPSVRVLRGGSWTDDAWYCRSARRDSRHPSHRLDFLGFRPVRMIDQARADAPTPEISHRLPQSTR
jgi:formylglycine-generating enzyme required for sulfatase activity